MISESVTVQNRLGLHARAAARLVNTASGFESEIWLRKGEQSVNGKSIMGVLTLAASRGTSLVIEANGDDEEQALEAITSLVHGRFGEDD